MSLAKTWLAAELAAGKTRIKAMEDLNRATGYRANHVQVYRWLNGGRDPRAEVRKYMIAIALPYVTSGLTDKQVKYLSEALT